MGKPKKQHKFSASNKRRLRGIFLLEGFGVIVWFLAIALSAIPNPLFELLQSQAMQNGGGNGITQIVIGIVIAVISLLFLKRFHFFGTFVSGLLGFMIFSGLSLFINPIYAAVFAALLVLYERKERSYASNNVLLLVALLFGAVPLGASYNTEVLIWFILILSVYDIIGVFVTRFIPNLAKQATQKQIPLLLLSPASNTEWRDVPKLKSTAAMLGAGDIFLPAIFLSSITINHDPITAIWVCLGSIVGILGNTIFASIIKTGIPAMPLLAIGMLITYFLAT